MEWEEEDLEEYDYEELFKKYNRFIDLSDESCEEITKYLRNENKNIYLLFDYTDLLDLLDLPFIDLKKIKLVKVSDPSGYIVIFEDESLFTKFIEYERRLVEASHGVFKLIEEEQKEGLPMVFEEHYDTSHSFTFYLYPFNERKIIEWCENS